MSCNHRYGRGYWHDCDGPPPEWYDGYGYRPRRHRDEVVVLHDDCDDEERPRRRRGSGRGRRCRDEQTGTAAGTPVSLQERAAALREELAGIEEERDALGEAGPRSVD